MRKLLLAAVFLCLCAANARSQGLGIEEKASLEKALTEKIQRIATPILGTTEFLVWVDMDVDLSLSNESHNETKPDPNYKIEAPAPVDDSMPGVDGGFLPTDLQTKPSDAVKIALANRPFIQDMSYKLKLPTNYIKRVTVRMVVPSAIPDSRMKTLNDLLTQVIPIEPARMDSLKIEKMAFNYDPMERFIYYKDKLGAAVFIAFALLTFAAFLFGPARSFLNRIAYTLENFEVKTTSSVKELIEQKESRDKQAGLLPGGPAGTAGLLTGPGGKVDDSVPFSFIRTDNLTKVLWTLEGADAQTVSVVAGHLAPDLSSQLIASLEPDKAKEVLLMLASPQSVDKEIITGLHQQLKAQVESVVGGVEHILQILDQQPPDKQQKLLAELKVDKPDVVDKIQGRLLTLEKVFRLDKGMLQSLLWEAYRQRITLGIVLKSLPRDLQQSGLTALPETLTRVVADEMNLPTTAGQLDTERRKFMALVRNLEKSGKISFAAKTV